MELPKTEQELQAAIDAAVKAKEDELTAKHNGAMANERTKHAAELEKAKKEASMSAEELANQRAKELAQAQENELNELREFKKTSVIKDKITSAGLPSYFVNDVRLRSAEEGDLDKVIKTIKSEYDANLPQGTAHSSVVQTSGKAPKPTPSQGGDGDEPDYSGLASALDSIIK